MPPGGSSRMANGRECIETEIATSDFETKLEGLLMESGWRDQIISIPEVLGNSVERCLEYCACTSLATHGQER